MAAGGPLPDLILSGGLGATGWPSSSRYGIEDLGFGGWGLGVSSHARLTLRTSGVSQN